MYSDSSSKILNKQFQSVFTKKSTTATPRLFGNKYPSIGNIHTSTVYQLFQQNSKLFKDVRQNTVSRDFRKKIDVNKFFQMLFFWNTAIYAGIEYFLAILEQVSFFKYQNLRRSRI